jgi:hypothetical protein
MHGHVPQSSRATGPRAVSVGPSGNLRDE